MDTKWTLFIIMLFAIGQLFATSLSAVGISSATMDQPGVMTGKSLESVDVPEDPSFWDRIPVLGAVATAIGWAFQAVGTAKDSVGAVVTVMAWRYDFLDNDIGSLVRYMFLWPLSAMMTFSIINFVTQIIRAVR